MTKSALLIGVSQYPTGLDALPSSVRDINALQEVLKDSSIGGFDIVKPLLNPDPLEMQSEIEQLFSDASRDDFVLLYFSGHGIKDDSGKLYFATSKTRRSQKNKIIKATTVPASFVHNMMDDCRARRQGIILDCCFSGAFDPNLAVKDDRSIDLRRQLGGEGRVVMTSSDHLQPSFGQKADASLSLYTTHLVEGLRTGKADIDQDGLISVQDLHRYVSNKSREHASNMTPKLITFKDLGFDIVLAKSSLPIPQRKRTAQEKMILENMKLSVSDNTGQRDYLPNFLDDYEVLIQDLISNLEDAPTFLSEGKDKDAIASEVLNIVQDSSEADFVLVLRSDKQGNLTVTAQSDFGETAENKRLISALKTHYLPHTSIAAIFNSEHHGIYKKCVIDNEELRKNFVFIPLDSPTEVEFMLVAGLSDTSPYLGNAYGKIMSSFYSNCRNLWSHPERVEAAIIDDLKESYKFISLSFYNRRFELFCHRLKQMTVYFEPILELDSLTISGWEALARDPKNDKAPVDLFHAAELWGVKFMIELDQHFLSVAVNRYREGRQAIRQNRTQDILPLSVNVYPESMARDAYFKTVERIVKHDRIIPGRKLILEISEKTSLPKYASDSGPKASWIGFKQALIKYVRELKVRCAIDDFGVEHASVSQLAGLQPPYIKIDREILFHESRDIIINFVHELGNDNTLNPPNVILEGFDEQAPVALSHLQEIGVNYIQGYVINRAQPKIYRLPEEKREELRALLNTH